MNPTFGCCRLKKNGKGRSELSLAEIQEPGFDHLADPRPLRARVLSLFSSVDKAQPPVSKLPGCYEQCTFRRD